MNWQDHKKLAIGLRNQSLADCVAARFALRPGSVTILDLSTTFAHVVTAKSHQALEKMIKGYLLWHSSTFDPTKGHTPFTDALALPERQRTILNSLCANLNRLDRRVVAELKWLESLAPFRPNVPAEDRGNPQPLTIIPENSEYPFWSHAEEQLVSTAVGISMERHAVRAIKTVRTFFSALAVSDPRGFTGEIREFLDQHPFSTAISIWPEATGN